MARNSVKLPVSFSRFTTERTLSGWLVVDRDGRPVADLTEPSEAVKLAEDLNLAAYGGGETLHRALGAT